jgi:hypothetical protein
VRTSSYGGCVNFASIATTASGVIIIKSVASCQGPVANRGPINTSSTSGGLLGVRRPLHEPHSTATDHRNTYPANTLWTA